MRWFLLTLLIGLPIVAQVSLPARRIVAPAAAALLSSLNTDLVSYWKMDETSGTRIDSEPSGTPQDLGSSNALYASGLITNALFGTNATYLYHADSDDLSVGDIDFTFAVWIKPYIYSSQRFIIVKGNNTSGLDYTLYYFNNQLHWAVNNQGVSTDLTITGLPSTNNWHLVVVWNNSTSNAIYGQIDNGAGVGTGHVGGSTNSTGQFLIGSYPDDPTLAWLGLIDEVGFWKRALTADERTTLYNGGTGITCCPFP